MGNSTSSDPPDLVAEDDPETYQLHDYTRSVHEKTVRYRVGNTDRTCTIRITNNKNGDFSGKLTVTLVDSSYGDEARVEVRVSTERNGILLKLAPVILHRRGNGFSKNRPEEKLVSLSYGCLLREGLMIIEQRTEDLLVVAHSYYISDRGQGFVFCIQIKCHALLGLSFTIDGPVEEAATLLTMHHLHSRRIQSMLEGVLNDDNNALQLHFALMALRGRTNGLVNNDGSAVMITLIMLGALIMVVRMML